MPDDKHHAKPQIDVRTLNLAQLKMLADKGSRRARAELEARMRAMSAGAAPEAASRARSGAPAQPSASSGFAPVTDFSALLAQPATQPASLQGSAPQPSPAAMPLSRAAIPPMPAVPAVQNEPLHGHDAMLERLHLLGQQEDARRRTEGPPRLVGLVLMGWGGLVVLAGLVTILAGSHYRGIGGYYLFGGVLCAVAGKLLWNNRRLAIYVHAAASALMLLWGMYWSRSDGVFSALMQSAPIWLSACWMAVGAIRDPLE